jgi:hypothetical protein
MTKVNTEHIKTPPSPEVTVPDSKIKQRRIHTAAYKTQILKAADLCKNESGANGALLRREGLSSSTLSDWRKHVSNDNPFSEAAFKTIKYCHQFPERFGSIEDTNIFCRQFFNWYNTEHKHSGIGYYSPNKVHYGQAAELERLRNHTLTAAFTKNPERFVNAGFPRFVPLDFLNTVPLLNA